MSHAHEGCKNNTGHMMGASIAFLTNHLQPEAFQITGARLTGFYHHYVADVRIRLVKLLSALSSAHFLH